MKPRILVNNHTEIEQKKTRPKQDKLLKLKTGLKTDDLSKIVYTGKCDALGGECACGKKNIVYRFLVVNPDLKEDNMFVVGSECISHFTPTVQSHIKNHEKQMKKKIANLKNLESEKRYKEREYKNSQPLRDELYELMKHPLIQDMLNFYNPENWNPANLKSDIYRIKEAIRTRTEREHL